ncbi:MAG: archease [bacterium]
MPTVSGFEIVEHTADIAIHAWAPNFEGLLTEFLKGLQTVVFGQVITRDATDFEELAIQEPGLEDALITVLNEAVFYIYHARRSPVAAGVSGRVPSGMKITWGLAPLDLARTPLLLDIKAATYHNLKVEHNGHYDATVVFDI